MKVMPDKNWAAAVSSVRSYSGRVKNHTRPPILSIETLQQLSLYWGGGGGGKKGNGALKILKNKLRPQI
jgi:hypothetical protein